MNIVKDYLTPNLFTGYKRDKTLAIALHWPDGIIKQTAKGIRNYFDSLPAIKRYASTQFAIGWKGEIIQMMDIDKRAYHLESKKVDPVSGKLYTDYARSAFGIYATNPVYSPSYCTIGIEMCHEFPDGRFSRDTLQSVQDLCVYLFKMYPNLDPEKDLTTHEAVVGWKWCPLWFHSHPEDLDDFKHGVAMKLKE
jgi:N-acetylmuramoyl-L-alanine amidase